MAANGPSTPGWVPETLRPTQHNKRELEYVKKLEEALGETLGLKTLRRPPPVGNQPSCWAREMHRRLGSVAQAAGAQAAAAGSEAAAAGAHAAVSLT